MTLIFSAESIHDSWHIITESVSLMNFWLFEPSMTSFRCVLPPQSQFKQWNFLRYYTFLTHFSILETFSKKLALSPILIPRPWKLVSLPRTCLQTIIYNEKLRIMTLSYFKKLANTERHGFFRISNPFPRYFFPKILP